LSSGLIEIHEAAHLLSGFLNGGKITKVVCNFDGRNSSTTMRHLGLWKNEISVDHPLTRQALMIYLCGKAAEVRLNGNRDMECSANDVHFAKTCLIIKGWIDDGLSDLAFFEKWGTQARRFVEHPIRWKIIQIIAAHLRDRHQISGQEAVKIITAEASKLSATDQLEFFYPNDGLGGDMLPLSEHGI
jgi:hypothetical protein